MRKYQENEMTKIYKKYFNEADEGKTPLEAHGFIVRFDGMTV